VEEEKKKKKKVKKEEKEEKKKKEDKERKEKKVEEEEEEERENGPKAEHEWGERERSPRVSSFRERNRDPGGVMAGSTIGVAEREGVAEVGFVQPRQ